MIKNNRIIVLDDSNFDENIQNQGDKLVLVDFWAEWCNPCKMFIPILEEVIIEYYETVQFCKINVDGNPLIVKKYNIRSIPTLLLFRDGVIVATKIGVLSKSKVQELLDFELKCKKT